MSEETPTRGEVWIVRLPRGIGVEPQRDRPCVVISSADYDSHPIRIIMPLSTWRPEFEGRANKLRIRASAHNGLNFDSAADSFQVRSVSTERFLARIGVIGPELLQQIVAGVAIAINYHA